MATREHERRQRDYEKARVGAGRGDRDRKWEHPGFGKPQRFRTWEFPEYAQEFRNGRSIRPDYGWKRLTEEQGYDWEQRPAYGWERPGRRW